MVSPHNYHHTRAVEALSVWSSSSFTQSLEQQYYTRSYIYETHKMQCESPIANNKMQLSFRRHTLQRTTTTTWNCGGFFDLASWVQSTDTQKHGSWELSSWDFIKSIIARIRVQLSLGLKWSSRLPGTGLDKDSLLFNLPFVVNFFAITERWAHVTNARILLRNLIINSSYSGGGNVEDSRGKVSFACVSSLY